MNLRRILILAAGLTAIASAAAAQTCPAPPTAPRDADRPIRPVTPVNPACVDAQGKSNKCSKAEIAKANAAIDAFNVANAKFEPTSKAYYEAMKKYLTDAQAYAKCEVGIMNGQPVS
jgi:hypothetical protein